jgi:hypothetical protein
MRTSKAMAEGLIKSWRKTSKIIKVGLGFFAWMLGAYFVIGLIIENASALPTGPMKILAGFESRYQEYKESDSSKKDSVIVGPSYAALLGSPEGAYNLGIVSGFASEVRFIVEELCRPEDSVLYIVNLHEANTLDIDVRIIRPELRNGARRRFTIFKEMCRYKFQMLGNSEESESSQNKGPNFRNEFSLESLKHVMNNPDATEEMTRRFELGLHVCTRAKDNISDLVDYYTELSTAHPNVTYVFLPSINDIRDGSNNKKLDKNILLFIEREKQLRDEMKRKGLGYVDLSKAGLQNQDYIDTCHLTKVGNGKVITFLREEGYL